MSRENANLIRSLYDAFSRGDLPGVLASFDPEIVWNEAENFPYADRNPYLGPDAVVQGLFARLGSEWDYWNVEIEEILDAGNTVVATGRSKAQHKVTRVVLDAQFVHIWRIRAGRIVQFQQYADTAQAQRAVGSA